MEVLTYYTVLTLTVRREKYHHYKLIWKLRQVMRGHALHPDIYDDDTIWGINWLIIGYRRQYFRLSLMPSESTVNRMEVQNSLPTSTLILLVNQLSMGIMVPWVATTVTFKTHRY